MFKINSLLFRPYWAGSPSTRFAQTDFRNWLLTDLHSWSLEESVSNCLREIIQIKMCQTSKSDFSFTIISLKIISRVPKQYETQLQAVTSDDNVLLCPINFEIMSYQSNFGFVLVLLLKYCMCNSMNNNRCLIILLKLKTLIFRKDQPI